MLHANSPFVILLALLSLAVANMPALHRPVRNILYLIYFFNSHLYTDASFKFAIVSRTLSIWAWIYYRARVIVLVSWISRSTNENEVVRFASILALRLEET